jgi:hypothetical protein
LPLSTNDTADATLQDNEGKQNQQWHVDNCRSVQSSSTPLLHHDHHLGMHTHTHT